MAQNNLQIIDPFDQQEDQIIDPFDQQLKPGVPPALPQQVQQAPKEFRYDFLNKKVHVLSSSHENKGSFHLLTSRAISNENILPNSLLVIAIFLILVKFIRAYKKANSDSSAGCLQNISNAMWQMSGSKRLFVALFVLYAIPVVMISAFFNMDNIFSFIYATMPIWINWFAYSAFANIRKSGGVNKSIAIDLVLIFVLMVAVFAYGYGFLFILISIPIWLLWLCRWVYLGYKKPKQTI